MPKTVKSLIFDLDMTLYRNSAYYKAQTYLLIDALARKFNWTFKEALEKVDLFQMNYSKENNGQTQSLGRIFESFGISIKENAQWRDQLFSPEIYLANDKKLKDILLQLKSRFTLSLLSNNTLLVVKKTTKALGIDGIFDHTIGLDSTYEPKPHIAPFKLAADQLKQPFSHIISIGDRLSVDIDLPVQAGMGGILIESMEDVYSLPEILK